MPPRRRCPICRSKKWHKEPASGLITCSEGHVLQDYINEMTETTELGPHAMKKRALKSGRRRKEKESKADSALYHGDRARYHYFQCLQLLLRMQVKTLIELWKLPSEFEVVCRDAWALHLSLLDPPIPAEPFLYAQEQEGGEYPSNKTPHAHESRGSKVNEDDPSGSSSSSSSSSSSENDDEDSEMADLLRRNSEIEDSDDGKNDNAPARPVTGRKKDKQRRDDSPAGNIAVLVFACWTLRVPVMYMDFIKAIEMYKLPYLDPTRLLPVSLTKHLTKHTKPKNVEQHYGIFTPESNAAPLVWRTVRYMGGNPVLYVLTKTLARILELPLTLKKPLAPRLVQQEEKRPATHVTDNVPPEVALVAAVVMALKMIYGLDGTERLPREEWDPMCAMPTLKAYLSHLEEMSHTEAGQDHAMFAGTSDVMPIFDFDGKELDRYMDFCERALLERQTNLRAGNNPVEDYFPIGIGSSEEHYGRASDHETKKTLPSASPVTDESEAWRPGQSYAVYSKHDVLGVLPEGFEMVVDRAAKWTGVSRDDICGVVERYERRADRWWENSQRREQEALGKLYVEDASR